MSISNGRLFVCLPIFVEFCFFFFVFLLHICDDDNDDDVLCLLPCFILIPAFNRNHLTNETAFKGLQIFPQNLSRLKRPTRGKYKHFSIETNFPLKFILYYVTYNVLSILENKNKSLVSHTYTHTQ